MKCVKYAAPALLAALLLAGSADAQRKPARKPPPKKPPVERTVVPPLEVRTAREKVSIQRDNVNRFIDVLGPIAQGIEDVDESTTTRRLPQAAYDKNESNKAKVITAIRNLKQALEGLESEFRTKTALQKYLPTIEGITSLAAQSEDSAIAGRFVASKDTLRAAGQKLTDTLATLPPIPTGAQTSSSTQDEKPKIPPRIGMTTREALLSTWGRPNDINKTTNYSGVQEQWVYGGYGTYGKTKYLYFTNGRLTSISE